MKFPTVITMLSVNGVVKPFEGAGEKAIRNARKTTSDRTGVKLIGFLIDDVFVAADLSTSFNSNRLSQNG